MSDVKIRDWLEQVAEDMNDRYTMDEIDNLIGVISSPGIDERYLDITALLADQNAQQDQYLYFVQDASDDPTVNLGYAYYEYLGTTVGDMTDYRKLSEEESFEVVLPSNLAFTHIDNEYTSKQTYTIPSSPTTREQLLKFLVSDAGNDQFQIANATSNDGSFAPSFAGLIESLNTLWALNFSGLTTEANDVSDSANFGLIDFAVFRTSNASDPLNGTLSNIVNRKLFTWRGLSGTNDIYMMINALGKVFMYKSLEVVGDIKASVKIEDKDGNLRKNRFLDLDILGFTSSINIDFEENDQLAGTLTEALAVTFSNAYPDVKTLTLAGNFAVTFPANVKVIGDDNTATAGDSTFTINYITATRFVVIISNWE